MASTKIINVLKDDSFSEILDIFKSTPAAEVIFVLPKRSKAFQKEAHFAALREEATAIKKTVSFLCSNPDINEVAKQYGFDVLLSRPASSSRKKSNSVNVVNQIEEFYQVAPAKHEIAIEEEPEAEEDVPAEPEELDESEPEAEEIPEDGAEDTEAETIPAVARRMAEIIDTDDIEDQKPVKISTAREKQQNLEVHHIPAAERGIDEDAVESMWRPEFVAKKAGLKTKIAPAGGPVKPKRRMRTRLIATFAVAIIVVAGGVLYMTTGSAQVTVQPQSTPINLALNIIAGENIAAVDAAGMKIPGQVFTVQKEVSQSAATTGQKDVAQKARGTITIYNETNAAQSLIATTRFTSADGHIFRTLTNVNVPAAKNATTPGAVDVQIIADKAGTDYNVAAGTFTIPAFQEKGDTTKFQKIYGKSAAAMKGGTSGKAKVVTQSDYDTLKATLTDQLKSQVQDELDSEANGLKVLGQSDIQVAAPTVSAEVDEAADTLTMTLKGTVTAVGFRESDIQSLIAGYVDAKNGLHVESDKISVTYSNDHYDPAAKNLAMTITVTGQAYAKIDAGQLTAQLLGKRDQDIKSYLENLPNITSANVILRPLWVRSIPKNSDKVHINFSY
ncbi:MAG TPA: hypothetical protein VG866_00670 [Candidatus Paceibacterota bacterium]|nr:hypothetical protein [Candidatus Paceibacterota bacterium]